MTLPDLLGFGIPMVYIVYFKKCTIHGDYYCFSSKCGRVSQNSSLMISQCNTSIVVSNLTFFFLALVRLRRGWPGGGVLSLSSVSCEGSCMLAGGSVVAERSGLSSHSCSVPEWAEGIGGSGCSCSFEGSTYTLSLAGIKQQLMIGRTTSRTITLPFLNLSEISL